MLSQAGRTKYCSDADGSVSTVGRRDFFFMAERYVFYDTHFQLLILIAVEYQFSGTVRYTSQVLVDRLFDASSYITCACKQSI